MKYKAVLFDMDGTVLDTLEDLKSAVNRTLSEFDMPQCTLEQVRCYVGNGARRLIEQAVPKGSSEETVEQTVQEPEIRELTGQEKFVFIVCCIFAIALCIVIAMFGNPNDRLKDKYKRAKRQQKLREKRQREAAERAAKRAANEAKYAEEMAQYEADLKAYEEEKAAKEATKAAKKAEREAKKK